MINLKVIHEGRFVDIRDFTLDDIMNLDNLSEENKKAFKTLGWDDENLEVRAEKISKWIRYHLPSLAITQLIKETNSDVLREIVEVTSNKETEAWQKYSDMCDDDALEALKVFRTDIRRPYIWKITLEEMMTLENDDDFDKKTAVELLCSLRKDVGITKEITCDNLSMGLIKYGFREYEKGYTREFIEEKINETFEIIKQIGMPSVNSSVFAKKYGMFPVVSLKMHNDNPIGLEAQLLANVSKRPRSKSFWVKYIRNTLVPLREKSKMDLKETILIGLKEIKEHNIRPLTVRDWLFGKGYVYLKNWKDILNIIDEIKEENTELEPVIVKAKKLLYLTDEIFETYLEGDYTKLDSSLNYVKVKRFTMGREQFIPVLRGLVQEWNKIDLLDRIDLNEEMLIRNHRLDTKYIEPIIMKIDKRLNEERNLVDATKTEEILHVVYSKDRK